MKNDVTEGHLQTLRERLQGHRLEAMLLLAMDIGLRRDELRGLTWPKVDLETGEIQVLNEKMKGPARLIPMPENLVHTLRRHALRQEKRNKDIGPAKQNLDFVFPDRTGGELSVQCFLQEWQVCCEHIGFPGLRFHDLRLLLWRRLRLQARHEQGGTKGDLNTPPNAEEAHDEHE